MEIGRPDGGIEITVGNGQQAMASAEDVALARQAQLRALRTEMSRLREELTAIAAGTSRLAVTEAVVILETTQDSIRRHLAPVLIAAGAIGYLWGMSLRQR